MFIRDQNDDDTVARDIALDLAEDKGVINSAASKYRIFGRDDTKATDSKARIHVISGSKAGAIAG